MHCARNQAKRRHKFEAQQIQEENYKKDKCAKTQKK